jgi:hypothetical protein
MQNKNGLGLLLWLQETGKASMLLFLQSAAPKVLLSLRAQVRAASSNQTKNLPSLSVMDPNSMRVPVQAATTMHLSLDRARRYR